MKLCWGGEERHVILASVFKLFHSIEKVFPLKICFFGFILRYDSSGCCQLDG